MPDEVPAVPSLKFTHQYDELNATPAGAQGFSLSYQTIRDRITSRQNEGYELVAIQTATAGLIPGSFAMQPGGYFGAEAFAVTLLFKMSNVDEQAQALRAVAEFVRDRVVEAETFKVTVASALKEQVDGLRHDVRLAIEGPITQAIKDDLEKRFQAIEAEIAALRD
jgi:hypothetical protein